MKTFQVIIPLGRGSKRFEYVQCTAPKAHQVCCDKAIKFFINQRVNNRYNPFANPIKLPNKIKVVEYDQVNKKPKKGGLTFNIIRCYIRATYGSGAVKMEEWYEPDKTKV